MSLADALAAEEAAFAKGPRCTVSLILRKLEPEDREALQAWMANPEKSHSVISAVLRGRGYRMQNTTMGRHRRGECACPR